jgi:PAS domain S-box-containing protein
MIDELKKLRELTEELTGNGYLRDQADEWEYALDAMPEFVFIINTQYVIKFINSALSNAMGAKSKDILFNKKVFDVLKIDEPFIADSLGTSKQGVEIFLDVFNKWFLCYFEPIKAIGGIIIGFICFLINITDRKKAEEEVAFNISRLQSLVNVLQLRFDSAKEFLDRVLETSIKLTESAFGYIYYYDEDTKEFDLNTWSKNVMIKCNISPLQTHYELSKTGIWGEAVRQRKPIIINDFSSDNPLKKGYPEGHVIIDKFMTVPIFSDDKIVAVIGMANKKADYNESDVLQLTLIMDVVWKVADRRKTAEALDYLSARHYALIEAIHDIVMEVDKNKVYVWANQAGIEFFGDDVIGKEACSYFVDKQNTYEEVQSLFYGNETSVYVESWQYRKDGERRLLAWWCKTLKNNKGDICVISSARDITEQELSKTLLQESEIKYRQLFENAPAGIYEIDLTTGRLLSVNDAMCEFSGYTRDELLSMSVFDILTDSSQKLLFERMSAYAAGKTVSSTVEYQIVRKDGNNLWIALDNRYVYKDGIPIKSSVIAHDITERKLAEKEAELRTI